jgi:YbbR domain-containing protein
VTRVEVNPPVITVNANVVPIPPQKVLPVIGQLSGHPAPGYQVTQIAVYPSSETVTGSASSLSGLTHLNTQPVSIAGARSTVTETVPVVLPSGVALVTEGKVTVTVTITKSS